MRWQDVDVNCKEVISSQSFDRCSVLWCGVLWCGVVYCSVVYFGVVVVSSVGQRVGRIGV